MDRNPKRSGEDNDKLIRQQPPWKRVRSSEDSSSANADNDADHLDSWTTPINWDEFDAYFTAMLARSVPAAQDDGPTIPETSSEEDFSEYTLSDVNTSNSEDNADSEESNSSDVVDLRESPSTFPEWDFQNFRCISSASELDFLSAYDDFGRFADSELEEDQHEDDDVRRNQQDE